MASLTDWPFIFSRLSYGASCRFSGILMKVLLKTRSIIRFIERSTSNKFYFSAHKREKR